jgi:hypothetical protein
MNQTNRTIVATVHNSHHSVTIPTMGRPWPKETTVQAFGNLICYDPTFASEKFKRDSRHIKHQSNTYLLKMTNNEPQTAPFL